MIKYAIYKVTTVYYLVCVPSLYLPFKQFNNKNDIGQRAYGMKHYWLTIEYIIVEIA